MRGADIGVHLVVCVLVGLGLGWLLDRWLGWQPWGMAGGVLLGFAAWFRFLLRRMTLPPKSAAVDAGGGER